jgi:hypothetical protein
MTNDSLELIAAARRGAERVWRDGHAYTKAGTMLDDLAAADMRPRTRFDEDRDHDQSDYDQRQHEERIVTSHAATLAASRMPARGPGWMRWRIALIGATVWT